MLEPYGDPSRHDSPWADVSDAEFDTWAWQVRTRIESASALANFLGPSAAEIEGLDRTRRLFRFGITPYYALLMDRSDPECPIRRQVIPRVEEATIRIGERADPLGEEPREVVPNLVHRYPDRVLLLATDRCPVYCRFCTRRRIVGRIERQAPRHLLADAFDYIRNHSDIREVIISGGDALMLADRQLVFIMKTIREISHVDIIRVATRMPVTCPMRVTEELVETMSAFKPIFVMTHFNHPRECTHAAMRACERFADAGIPVYNQTVLLKGINNSIECIRELNRRLITMRVTPYYLHQCDLAQGIEHFRTPLSTGLEIIDGLRGHSSGLMVPQLCVDVPGGVGKVTLVPEWVVERSGRATSFKTYTGEMGTYFDPPDG